MVNSHGKSPLTEDHSDRAIGERRNLALEKVRYKTAHVASEKGLIDRIYCGNVFVGIALRLPLAAKAAQRKQSAQERKKYAFMMAFAIKQEKSERSLHNKV
jgi:hypothetical protein